MDKNIEVIKHLYLVPNTFQIWAWILTLLAVLFCFKSTRRIGGTWFLVVLICMALFFGVNKAMHDFAPTEVPKETQKPAANHRH